MLDALVLMSRFVGSRVNPAFALEVLPNRDSIPYKEKYGIPDVASMFRGTLRYEVSALSCTVWCGMVFLRHCFGWSTAQGFSSLMSAFACLGFLNGDPCAELDPTTPAMSCKAYFASLIPAGSAALPESALLSLAVCAGLVAR